MPPRFQYKMTKAQKRSYGKKHVQHTKVWRSMKEREAFAAGVKAAKKRQQSALKKKGYF